MIASKLAPTTRHLFRRSCVGRKSGADQHPETRLAMLTANLAAIETPVEQRAVVAFDRTRVRALPIGER